MEKKFPASSDFEAPKPRRSYTSVDIARRLELIRLVSRNAMKVSKAAKIAGVNYEAAKHIVQDFRRTGHCEPLRLRKRKEKYARLATVAKALQANSAHLEELNHMGTTAGASMQYFER